LMRTSGVSPIASRIVLQILFTKQVYTGVFAGETLNSRVEIGHVES
jgi:hypothetical protein